MMLRSETGILVRLVRFDGQTSPKFSGSNGEVTICNLTTILNLLVRFGEV